MALPGASRILIAVVLLWIIFILFIGGPLLKKSDTDYNLNSENGELILARLSRASSELESLKAQNDELRSLLQNYIPIELQLNKASRILTDNIVDEEQFLLKPNQDFELARRRLSFNLNELWFFLKNYIMLNSSFLEFIDQHRANFLHDLDVIEARDYEWRKNEYKKLTQIVSDAIERLQNPKDCDTAKKLVCHLNKGCGFGCQIHHVSYCIVTALATKRTLILDSYKWRYTSNTNHASKNPGWNLVFQPLSTTCTSDKGSSRSVWKLNADLQATQVVDLPIIDTLNPRPDFLPSAIPKQIAPQLIMLHGAPIVWFIGQIVKFIMRPTLLMQKFLEKAESQFNFRTPIVGIHVRRTDKVGTEASFHPLSEYMKYADNFYKNLEIKNQRLKLNVKVEKVIYLATDESSVWNKEIKPFEEKGFIFIGDSKIAQTANLGQRYTVESLKNVILDIWLLSKCNHLVCTFSSQVCRLAFELMQTRGIDEVNKTKLDWSDAYNSLDDIYYFGGQQDHNQIAILNNLNLGNTIDMKIGDLIGIAGNHWNGFSKGVNRRTKQSGLYPGFKTSEKIEIANFEAFEE